MLGDVAKEAEKARGGQRRKRGARGDARGDSRSTRARGNASEAPRSGRPRARSSDDGRGSIPRGVGRHARVEKSCGGLKSGAGTEKPSARRCGDRVPPRRRRRELIAPRGTRLGLTSPEHLQGPFPGPPPPSAFAGLHGRASHNAWRTKKRTCLIELSRPEVFGGEVRFVCTTLARTNIESIIQSGIKGKSRNVCAAVLKRSIAVRRRRRRSARRVQKLPRARWGRSAPMTG